MSFTAIVALMITGDLLTFYQVQVSRRNVQKSLDADQKQVAVLRVHTDVLQLGTNLSRPIANRDPADLKSKISAIRQALLGDLRHAKQSMAESPASPTVDAKLLAILQVAESVLPEQLAELEALTAAGDWQAAQARFSKQIETWTALTSQAANSVSDEVSGRRVLVLAELQTAQHRLEWILAITALVSILAASGLGANVTAGITRPLRELESAAKSLAAGNFSSHAQVAKTDELATLRSAFDFATSELNQLYKELTSREARFRALIEHSSDLVAVVNPEGLVHYASPSCSRIAGVCPEQLIGRNFLDLVDARDLFQLKSFLTSLPDGGRESIEFRLCDPHGNARTLEGFATNLCSEPAVRGILVNLRDVSDKKQAESEIVSLSRCLIVAQEKERARIAGELHDDFGQRIAAVTISLSGLRREIPAQIPALQQHTERIHNDLTQIGDSIRRLSHTLHPALLEHCGLPTALRALSSEFSGLYVRFSCPDEDRLNQLPADTAMCLYRVAQEALRNVLKHSAVSDAELTLDLCNDCVRLMVQDRGIGIKTPINQAFRGLGLVSMRERVRQQRGIFSVENLPGGGTRLLAIIPQNAAVAVPEKNS